MNTSGRIAGIEKAVQLRLGFARIALIEERKAGEVNIRGPVRLGGGEPLGKEPDDELRRVHPTIQQPAHRRKSETGPEGVHGGRQMRVYDEPVRGAQIRSPEKPRQKPENVRETEDRRLPDAAKHDRLQMHGRQGQAQFLVRNARAERQAGCGHHHLFGLAPLREELEDSGDVRHDQAPRHNGESSIRTPNVGVLNRRVVVLHRAQPDKLQSHSARQGLEVLGW